ncbi:MAG: TrmH family RNA methyltransferase [Deltaproteobacteria bacterium]|nr:MAG: TrmH family RNA methyltransferase [Deltaproteobacteria bacterium]
MDERRQRIRDNLLARLDRVCVAIEALHHRHNVSAVMRTADALGIHRVHLVEGHFKPSKGAARGAERWLEIYEHANADDAVEAIRAAGYEIWIADLGDGAVTPAEVPVDRRICLWFGAELVGVSDAARAAAEGVVQIPMRGFAQSLNVSVSAGMILSNVAERARQLGREVLLTDEAREAQLTAWFDREDEVMYRLNRRSGGES